jgi:hypothetical protein
MKREGFYIRLGLLGFSLFIFLGFIIRSYPSIATGFVYITVAVFVMLLAAAVVMFIKARYGQEFYATNGDGIAAIAPVIGIAIVMGVALILGGLAGG